MQWPETRDETYWAEIETYCSETETRPETHRSEIKTRPRCWGFYPRLRWDVSTSQDWDVPTETTSLIFHAWNACFLLNIPWKFCGNLNSEHFLRRYKRKPEWVIFSEHSVYVVHAVWYVLVLGIHSKNLVAILHLLVTLARFYRAPIRLPENVIINVIVVQVSLAVCIHLLKCW